MMKISITIGILFSSMSALATNDAVTLIETDDARCVMSEAKLVSIQRVDAQQDWVVWVDRWYMQVQTADHTKHILTASNPIVDLGCSITRAGPQHWTIDSAIALQASP